MLLNIAIPKINMDLKFKAEKDDPLEQTNDESN
jgi:hypothetical protein